MRLFIAIRFDDGTLDALEAVRDRLFAHAASGSPVPRDNLHLTLLFLGDIEEDDLPAVEDALDQVNDSLALDLVFDRVGSFGGRARKAAGNAPTGDTWWVGIADNPALTKLQAHIEDRMRKLGVDLEHRSYVPHITLGRRVVLADGADANQVEREALARPLRAHTDSFSLMESNFPKKRHAGPPTYVEVCSWEQD